MHIPLLALILNVFLAELSCSVRVGVQRACAMQRPTISTRQLQLLRRTSHGAHPQRSTGATFCSTKLKTQSRSYRTSIRSKLRSQVKKACTTSGRQSCATSGSPRRLWCSSKKSIAQSPGHSESHLKLGANWSAAITSPPLTEHLKVLRAWSRSVPPDRGSGSSDGIQIRSLARRGEGHHRSL